MTLMQFVTMSLLIIAGLVSLIAHEFTAAAVLMGFSGMMLFLSEAQR